MMFCDYDGSFKGEVSSERYIDLINSDREKFDHMAKITGHDPKELYKFFTDGPTISAKADNSPPGLSKTLSFFDRFALWNNETLRNSKSTKKTGENYYDQLFRPSIKNSKNLFNNCKKTTAFKVTFADGESSDIIPVDIAREVGGNRENYLIRFYYPTSGKIKQRVLSKKSDNVLYWENEGKSFAVNSIKETDMSKSFHNGCTLEKKIRDLDGGKELDNIRRVNEYMSH